MRESLQLLQAHVSSEWTFGTGGIEQASKMPHQGETIDCPYMLVHPSPQLVSIRTGPPIEPTPILFSYCIFIALTANRELGFSNKKQALGEEWSYSLCSRPQVGISKGPSIHLPVSATCE